MRGHGGQGVGLVSKEGRVSRFRVSARAVLRSTAPSSGHAWIAFLRCVEAHAVLSGTSFTALLARLSTTHDIHPRGRPPTARLQAAVRELQQERSAVTPDPVVQHESPVA